MNGTVDRISSLPDDVLTHILSFVTTREAVQTCILSKRWRNTWASVPVLTFESGYAWRHNPDVDYKFDQFVNGVLGNREPLQLESVIYKRMFHYGSCEPSMEGLHRIALLDPRVIQICINRINGVDQFDLPESLFSCASLKDLTLFIDTRFFTTSIGPKSISLPSLKILELRSLRLDNNFTQKLLLGCPALESLTLDTCELFISDISSNVLKKLAIYYCWYFQHMQISCPSLVSLSIHSSMEGNGFTSLENMASLVDADIAVFRNDVEVDGGNMPNPNFLRGLFNATDLNLDFHDLPQLKNQWKKDICHYRIFKNLKSLEIVSCFSHFDLVACFLEHSPVLEQLNLFMWLNRRKDAAQEEPMQGVIFQREYLETVNICCGKKKKIVSMVVSMLTKYVKTIGNINIL